jgi:hypothetical protein
MRKNKSRRIKGILILTPSLVGVGLVWGLSGCATMAQGSTAEPVVAPVADSPPSGSGRAEQEQSAHVTDEPELQPLGLERVRVGELLWKRPSP